MTKGKNALFYQGRVYSEEKKRALFWIKRWTENENFRGLPS